MKVTFTIPTSLKEIKVKDYQKYLNVVKDNEANIEFINIKCVEIFCSLKINDINAIRVNDFNDILRQLTKTFEVPNKFKTKFKHNGVEYGFIPDLENMTMGEYVDLNTYLSDPKTIHKALAVMYRPIKFTKKDMYLIEDYESANKYETIMREVPTSIFLGAQVFFYDLGKELLNASIHSLPEDQRLELERLLAKSGVGISQFTHLLEEVNLNLKTQLN